MLKKLLFWLGGAFVVSGAIAYYFWQEATHIPQWYQASRTEEVNPSSVTEPALPPAIEAKIATQIQQKSQGNPPSNQAIAVNLSYPEVNQWLTTEINQQLRTQTAKVLPSAPTIQTQLKDNRLEIGTVINSQQLASAKFSRSQQAIVDRLMTNFPQLQNQTFYLGVEGKPQVKEGQLVLDKNSQVRVGNLTFSVTEVAQKIGVSPQTLQRALTIDLGNVNLQDWQFQDQNVLLKVAPQSLPASP
ncbi:MAG: hypothetical protein ACKN9E_15895 [Microcystaceae cyanobacterium]